jgi:hypothetical protein
MSNARCVSLAFIVLIVAACSATCFSQSPATTSPSQAAYVYVGTSKGVYLYDASTNGALTAVSGR